MFGQVARGDSDILFQRRPGRYLGNYMIRSLKTEDEFDCSNNCFNEPGCVSVNLKVKGRNKGLCELNSKTLELFPEEGQSDAKTFTFKLTACLHSVVDPDTSSSTTKIWGSPVVCMLDSPVIVMLDSPVVVMLDSPVVVMMDSPVVVMMDSPDVVMMDSPDVVMLISPLSSVMLDSLIAVTLGSLFVSKVDNFNSGIQNKVLVNYSG
ncbi:cellulosomal scaffoldin anchoring C [Paramuricea clavata]|uniref:Cellulosomal scaffoldin anchoring C, partial n=1 Tax=Paramuricea clavata TaxID=317549 RepID=A0A6S7I9H6_PARCT|nr:cellulosomal scaffoldin anchoring C [Paramuricea clavata]